MEVIDTGAPLNTRTTSPIHRSAPAFIQLDTKLSILKQELNPLSSWRKNRLFEELEWVKHTHYGIDQQHCQSSWGVSVFAEIKSSSSLRQMNEPPGARMRVGLTALTMRNIPRC
ncbi:hypothetical protein DVH24_037519 [Malus domestica]|uniref:Uncharacterized protein n=1 Tax=Malus domestica TaxID=3750 RepID=A0A498KQ40_MALDO|nr:hypothetical protein DVH24_037519 [Malus domestica]